MAVLGPSRGGRTGSTRPRTCPAALNRQPPLGKLRTSLFAAGAAYVALAGVLSLVAFAVRGYAQQDETPPQEVTPEEVAELRARAEQGDALIRRTV